MSNLRFWSIVTLLTGVVTDGQPKPDSITRYYFGGAYETTGTLTAEDTWKKYYSFAGQTITMKDDAGIKYFLTDHLGSILSVIGRKEDGTLEITQQRYFPFGQVRADIGSISHTDFGYTGQRELDEGMGGIMDYKARFYSPYINRFLSGDTIVPDYTNPQSLNRYSYVINNPLRYTDPTGHMMSEGKDGGCGSRCQQQTVCKKYLGLQKQMKKKGEIDDLEALAQLAEFAATLTPRCTACFVNNMGAVLTGYTGMVQEPW